MARNAGKMPFAAPKKITVFVGRCMEALLVLVCRRPAASEPRPEFSIVVFPGELVQ